MAWAAEGLGLSVCTPRVDIRTGDTPAPERARQAREPAEILVTTPVEVVDAAVPPRLGLQVCVPVPYWSARPSHSRRSGHQQLEPGPFPLSPDTLTSRISSGFLIVLP